MPINLNERPTARAADAFVSFVRSQASGLSSARNMWTPPGRSDNFDMEFPRDAAQEDTLRGPVACGDARPKRSLHAVGRRGGDLADNAAVAGLAAARPSLREGVVGTRRCG